jgi:hypothetical protein
LDLLSGHLLVLHLVVARVHVLLLSEVFLELHLLLLGDLLGSIQYVEAILRKFLVESRFLSSIRGKTGGFGIWLGLVEVLEPLEVALGGGFGRK